MTDKSYLTIQSWMVTDLHLKGNELMAYALIWGFSQDGQSCFYGSFQYVMAWLSIDKTTAIRVLQKLEAKGLIRKWQETVNGVVNNRYSAITDPDELTTIVHEQNTTGGKMQPVAKSNSDPLQNTTQTGGKMQPNNKSSNKYNNKPRAHGCEKGDQTDTPADVFNNFANGNQALLQSLQEFDEHRRILAAKDKKKAWTALAAKKICKSLVRLTKEAGVQDRTGYMIAMLDQSIENSWTGVFAAKDFIDRAPQQPRRAVEPDQPRFVSSDMTLEELLGGGKT